MNVYKASINRAASLADLESAVAAGNGLIYRVDQEDGHTRVFFSGSDESVSASKDAFAKLGDVNLTSSSEKELFDLR